MSIKAKVFTVLATLTLAGGLSTVGSIRASAATPACGSQCISIFSKALGSYADPNLVEDVLNGVATVGQPVILKQASGSDPSEDLLRHAGPISAFYAAGMVSAAVNSHYGGLTAAQLEYAPFGVGSGLCVAVATVAYQNEGLTLQPCGVPARTVWIIDTADSPTTLPYFPIVNASTEDFSRPFAMALTQDEIVSAQRTPQILVRRLQFLTDGKTLPDSQLWGAHSGVLN